VTSLVPGRPREDSKKWAGERARFRGQVFSIPHEEGRTGDDAFDVDAVSGLWRLLPDRDAAHDLESALLDHRRPVFFDASANDEMAPIAGGDFDME
jgi:hypothetical protein